MTGDQIGILPAALTLSIDVGTATGGRLGDRLGRKPVFSVTTVGIAIAMACDVFAPGFEVLLVGAILCGLSTGVDPPLVQDLAGVHRRLHHHVHSFRVTGGAA